MGIKRFLFHFFIGYGAYRLSEDIFNIFAKKYFKSDEDSFWENHPFEDALENADDLCEIGYNFQRNEIIYKKISEKKWSAEILIPDDNEFEIDYELTIENYIYKNIGKKLWTIERLD